MASAYLLLAVPEAAINSLPPTKEATRVNNGKDGAD
jgi:hypothetical protein